MNDEDGYGLEYVFEKGMVTRSAVLGWVALPFADGRSMLRLTGVVPTSGNEGVSLLMSLVINF